MSLCAEAPRDVLILHEKGRKLTDSGTVVLQCGSVLRDMDVRRKAAVGVPFCQLVV